MKDDTRKQIHVGTSGWQYTHWIGVFYPEKIRSSSVLSFYAGQFETVEINNSFYQIPAKETLEQWSDTVQQIFFT